MLEKSYFFECNPLCVSTGQNRLVRSHRTCRNRAQLEKTYFFLVGNHSRKNFNDGRSTLAHQYSFHKDVEGDQKYG